MNVHIGMRFGRPAELVMIDLETPNSCSPNVRIHLVNPNPVLVPLIDCM